MGQSQLGETRPSALCSWGCSARINFSMAASSALRTVAWFLQACLLLSCSHGIIRPVLVPRPEDLHKLALVIQQGPDGSLTHSWRPAAEFQEALQNLPSSIRDDAPWEPIVLASSRKRDCDQEQLDCHRNCMRRKLPAPHNYIPRGNPRHDQICRDRCLPPYLDCVDAEKSRALRFPAVDGAVEWLKEHRTQLLVGAVVVIAGVTFVVVSAGAGLAVLAPLALMTSTDSAAAPLCAGGSP